MDDLIDRSLVGVTFQNKKHGCSLFYPLALYCEKWPKMAMFMRAGK